MAQNRNLSQSNYIPISEPVTILYLCRVCYFSLLQGLQGTGVRVRLGIRLPNIYTQKFSSKFGEFSEIDLRFNQMERSYQSLTVWVNYVNSFPLTYPTLVVN